MNATVIIPWRGGCPHRQAALRWVCRRLASRHPHYQRLIGVCPPGPWSKGAAVAAALPRVANDLLVVHDADVWSDALGDAVNTVADGAAWAMPHKKVHRLDEAATRRVLAGGEPSTDDPCTEVPYTGWFGGGIVVMPRATYQEVPLDPRFHGWGQEDDAWGMALDLLAGPCARSHRPLFHLWHPPAPRDNRRVGSDANGNRLLEYRAAMRSPDRMRDLVKGGGP